jgi:hypothetical protein
MDEEMKQDWGQRDMAHIVRVILFTWLAGITAVLFLYLPVTTDRANSIYERLIGDD